ncbi:hypothetical protein [Paenimyroides ceti]
MKMYEFNEKYDKKRGRFAVKFAFNSFEQTFLKAFRNIKKDNIEVFPDNGGIEFTVEVTCTDGSKKAFRSFMVGRKLTKPSGPIYQFDEIS